MEIRKIREKLGLRQSDLATMLGIRLDELKAGESGRRPIPNHAQGILASMADFLEENSQNPVERTSFPQEREKQLRYYTKEKARLEWELEALLIKKSALNQLLDFTEKWSAFSPDPMTENQRLLLEALHLRAIIGLEDDGPGKELYIRLRLAEVQAALQVLEAWGK